MLLANLISWLRLVLLFGQVVGTLLLRSSPSGALTHRMRGVVRLRKRRLVAVSVPQRARSLRLHPAESSRVRVRAFPLRFSASAPGSDVHRRPPPPNNSFKPTPCRGIGRVLYATLTHVRRPATGRLNSGVRRQKSVLQLCFPQLQFLSFVWQCSSDNLRARCHFGDIAWRAHTSHALRCPASETVIGAANLSATDAVASETPG